MPSLSHLITTTGAFLLLHAAYSCLHYRSVLEDWMESGYETTTSEEQVPPPDVILECALAWVLLLAAELMRSSSGLRPVMNTGGRGVRLKPLVAPLYKSRDYDVYTTRGSGL